MFQTKLRTLAPLLALLVGFTAASYADNEMSDKDRRWMEEEVGAIITADEIRVYQEIDKDDRKLFKEIFWKRRDTNPKTKDNEFEDQYKKQRKAADKKYKSGKTKGFATDMGKIFLLLGEPNRTEPKGQNVAWIYDANPQKGIPDMITAEFQGNQLVKTAELDAQLERVKTRKITNPTVMYARDMEGRLLEPRANFDPEGPANMILTALVESQTPASDIGFEPKLAFFRATEGSIYVPILYEIDDSALTWQGEEADTTVFGLVENSDGFNVFQFEEPVKLTKTSDGRTMYEMPVQLGPGSYKFYLGVRDNASATAGTKIEELEIPDYFSGELVMSSVVCYNEGKEVQEPAGTPGHAFQFGPVQFRPATLYTKADTVGFFFFVYGAGLDAAGKPNITGQYIFYLDGKKKGQTKDAPLQANEKQAVGDADPSSGFDPGNYRMQIKVTDHVLKKTLTENIEFVLEGAGETQ